MSNKSAYKRGYRLGMAMDANMDKLQEFRKALRAAGVPIMRSEPGGVYVAQKYKTQALAVARQLGMGEPYYDPAPGVPGGGGMEW